MTQRTFLTIHSIAAAGYGVLFLLIPGTMLPLYGAEPTAAMQYLGRQFGSALLTFGAVLWLASDAVYAVFRGGYGYFHFAGKS